MNLLLTLSYCTFNKFIYNFDISSKLSFGLGIPNLSKLIEILFFPLFLGSSFLYNSTIFLKLFSIIWSNSKMLFVYDNAIDT